MNLRTRMMNLRTAVVTTVLATGLVTAGLFLLPVGGETAMAQTSAGGVTAGPTKIAVVNTSKVFSDIQEFKDFRVKAEMEQRNAQQAEDEKSRRLKELKDSLSLLKPGSSAFFDKNRELIQADLDHRVWAESTTQQLNYFVNSAVKQIFDKIQASTAQLATQKGFDIVFSDTPPAVPENLEKIPTDQLRALITMRSVLFASPTVDLTSEVTAMMDTQYKAAPAPAPAPGK